MSLHLKGVREDVTDIVLNASFSFKMFFRRNKNWVEMPKAQVKLRF